MANRKSFPAPHSINGLEQRSDLGHSNSRHRINLVSSPILPTLLRLSLPNTVAMSATVLVAVAETAYVGRLGTASLAGIAVVFPIVVLQQSFSNGAMGGGVSSAISRALGANDEQRAQALALHAMIIGIVAGFLSAACMLLFGPQLFRLLGASGDALSEALRYSNLVFLGSPMVWLTGMLISVVRGGGNMRVPSLVTLALLTAQAALGALFGLGLGPFPRLGMFGIALALVAAYASATVFLFWYLRSTYARVPLSLIGLKRELFAEILSVGLLTCISPLQTTLTVLIVTGLISNQGTEVLAGYGIGARLETVLVPIAFGIGVACVPMVGMAVGAGDVIRARRVAAVGAALSALILGTIGATVVIAPQLWADFFTSSRISREVAYTYLVWSGPAYAFFGVGLCLLFASQGARKVLGPVLAGSMRLGVMAVCGWWLAYKAAPLWSYFALVAGGMAVYGIGAAWAVYITDWRPVMPNDTSGAQQPALSPRS